MPSNFYKSKSIFGTLCKKSGFILKNGQENNEISVDKSVFQKNITLELKHQQGDISEVVEEFIEGFNEYVEDFQRFHKSLLSTFTTKDCNSARSPVQDSLIRMLLGVEALQPTLIKNLLEKLPELSQDIDGESANIPRLVLSQFRWLDFVVESKALTKLLLELIEATELDVQKEIISVLPSIVDESDHVTVAGKLKDMLVSQTQLTIIILDALVCLDLAPDILVQVRGAATRALQSVDAENLPVVLKFLFKTAAGAELTDVLGEIRNGLDLSVVARSTRMSKKSNRAAGEVQDSIILIIDTIQSSIQFQRGLADTWLKTIDSTKEKLSALDFVVLLILYQTKHRRAVEALVRNKIRGSAISESLLVETFQSHSQILQTRFKAILSLSEVLLKSSEVSLSYIGSVLYKLSFKYLDTFCKQEIVASLVMHLGSGNAEESTLSLDVLASLVEHHLTAMAPFAIFFKRLLDFQQQSLPLLGMRKLFGMLSRLAFSSAHDPAMIQDDLHMVIRKLVSSDDPKYLCRGVVGGVMMVLGMGYISCEGQEMSEAHQKEVINLLTMIRSGSSRQCEAAALFLDELAAMVSHAKLHSKVENWILENMTEMFQESFVVDIIDDKTSVCGLPMSVSFGLNEKEESTIAINLLPMVAAEIMEPKSAAVTAAPGGTSSQNQVYTVCLSPHFRLVQMGERRSADGNMEGIDALLGCPLYMPEDSVYTKLVSLSDKEKDVLCTTLFHALNWFREIVNAFASQASVDMKGKVIERLHDITSLTKVLSKCLAAHSKYNPAMWNLASEEMKPPAVPAVPKKGKGKGAGEKKKGRKRKRGCKENESSTSGTQDVSMQVDKTAQEDSQGAGGDGERETAAAVETGDLTAYAHCFRELDLEVFNILHSGPITQASLDSNLHTKRTSTVQIETPQLLFLLDDLVRKLNHSLIALASKRRSFPGKARGGMKQRFSNLDQMKSADVARFSVDLLPALCTHLESTSAFFQALMADNDGLVDGPGYHTPEAVQRAACFHLLLQTLVAHFSWTMAAISGHWHVLEFSVEEGECPDIEVVPDKWVLFDRKMAYWPSAASRRQWSRVSKPPEKTWPLFNYKTLHKSFTNYEDANKAADFLVENTELESQEEESVGNREEKRKRKPQNRWTPSQSPRLASPVRSPTPPSSRPTASQRLQFSTPPHRHDRGDNRSPRHHRFITSPPAVTPQHRRRSRSPRRPITPPPAVPPQGRRSRSPRRPITSPPAVPTQRQRNLSPNIRPSASTPMGACSTCGSSNYKPFFERLFGKVQSGIIVSGDIIARLDRVEGLLETLLREREPARDQPKRPSTVSSLPAGLQYPLTSADDVEILDAALQDAESRASAVRFLTTIGGSHAKDLVCRMHSRILAPSASKEFNLTGKKGKRKFNTCATLRSVIFESIVSFTVARNGYELSENNGLLKESLTVLTGRVTIAGATQRSIEDLFERAYSYIEKFCETVPNLLSATLLVRLLTVLANRAEEEPLQRRLADLCQKLLQREWRDAKGQQEKGAQFNEMIQTLVQTWVRNSADPTKAMQQIAETGMTQLLPAARHAVSDTFPTLTRSSFPVFLRVVLGELVENLRRISALKKSCSRQEQEAKLLRWSVGVKILFMAVNMVKEFNSRAAIAACLKYGRQFVEVFLLRGMPVLDATFTSQSAEVHGLLRSLQQSTRTLQNMCGHAKRTQDVSQVNQVPLLKRALERLVLRVKQMLTVNNCQRAFWIGNLKNKTLKGEEILSQATSEADKTEEEETMPEDDEDSEVEMDTTEKDSSRDSSSEDEANDGSISDTY